MSEKDQTPYEFCFALNELKNYIKEYLESTDVAVQAQVMDQMMQKMDELSMPEYLALTETQKYDVLSVINLLSLVYTFKNRTDDFNYQLARYLKILCRFDKLGQVLASAAVSVVYTNFEQFIEVFDVADEISSFLHLLRLFNANESSEVVDFIKFKFSAAQISALCAASGSTAAPIIIYEKLEIADFEQNDLNLILESIILYYLNQKEIDEDFARQFFKVLYQLSKQLEEANEHFVRAMDLLYQRVSGEEEDEQRISVLTDIIINIPEAPKWLTVPTCYSILRSIESIDFADNCKTYLLQLYEYLFPLHITEMLKAELLTKMPHSSTKLDSDLYTMLYSIILMINKFEKGEDEDISTADFAYRILSFYEAGNLVELFEMASGAPVNQTLFTQFISTAENQQKMEVLYNNFMQFEYFTLNLEFGILPPYDFVSVFEQMNFPLVLLTKALKSAIAGFQHVRYASADNDDYIKKRARTQLLAFFNEISVQYDKFHFGKNIMADFIGACFEFNNFLRLLDSYFQESRFVNRLFSIVKDVNCRDYQLFALYMIREIPESFVQPYFLQILPEMQKICSSDPSEETMRVVIQIIENMSKIASIDLVGALIGLYYERSVEFLHFAVNFLQQLEYVYSYPENFYKILEVFVVGVFTASSEEETTALNHIFTNMYHFYMGWFVNCCVYTMINRKCKKFGKIVYGLENMVLYKPKIVISYFDYKLLEQLLNCNKNTDIIVLELLFKIMNSHAILECTGNNKLQEEAQKDLTPEICNDLTNLFVQHYYGQLTSDMLLFKIFCQQINMLDIKYFNKNFTSAKFYHTVLNHFLLLCNQQFYVLVSSLSTGYYDDNAYSDFLANAEIYNTSQDYYMLPEDIYRPELDETVGVTPVDIIYLLNSCTDILCRNDEYMSNIIEFDRLNLLDLLRLSLEIAYSMKLQTRIRHSAVELIYQLSYDVLSVLTIAYQVSSFWNNEYPKLTELPSMIATEDVQMAVEACCNMTEIIALTSVNYIARMNQNVKTNEYVQDFYRNYDQAFEDPRTRNLSQVPEYTLLAFVSAFAHDGKEELIEGSEPLTNLEACIGFYADISPEIAKIDTRHNVTPAILLGACILTSLQYLMQGSFERYAEYLRVAEDLLLSLQKVDFPDVLELARFIRTQIGQVVAQSQANYQIVYQAWQISFYSEILRFYVNLQKVLEQPNGKLAVLELFKSMLAEENALQNDENALVSLAVNTYLLICPIEKSVLDDIVVMLGMSIVQECVRYCCVAVLKCYSEEGQVFPPLAALQIGSGGFEPRYLEKETTGGAEKDRYLYLAYQRSASCIETLFEGYDDYELSDCIVKFLKYDLTAREVLPLQQALAASLPLSKIQTELCAYEEFADFSPVIGHYYAKQQFSAQDMLNFEALMSKKASYFTFSSLICAFQTAVVMNSRRAAETIFEAAVDCDDVEVERQYGLILKIVKFCQSDAKWWTYQPAFTYHIDLIYRYCQYKEQVFLSRELEQLKDLKKAQDAVQFRKDEVLYMFSISDAQVE